MTRAPKASNTSSSSSGKANKSVSSNKAAGKGVVSGNAASGSLKGVLTSSGGQFLSSGSVGPRVNLSVNGEDLGEIVATEAIDGGEVVFASGDGHRVLVGQLHEPMLIGEKTSIAGWAVESNGGPSGPSGHMIDLFAPAATALLAGGLLVGGAMAGTSSTAPIPIVHVRHADGTSSGSRVFYTIDQGAPALRRGPATDLLTVSPMPGRVGSPEVTVEAAPTVKRAGVSSAADVAWLHEASGLTWDQLGKAFGVSRRAVHIWANGGRLNATNAERLARFVAVVRGLRGTTPDERRAELLAPGSTGVSILNTFRTELEARPAVNGIPFTPDQLMGARHDHVADDT